MDEVIDSGFESWEIEIYSRDVFLFTKGDVKKIISLLSPYCSNRGVSDVSDILKKVLSDNG